MSHSTITVTPELKFLIGQTVGYVQVNKKFVHHNNNYECAAWWEDSEIQTGTYPLILEENYLHPKNLKLSTKLNAVVVDDFFPALWGGVSVSDKPYKPKNIGDTRLIHQSFSLVDSILSTGNSPGSEKDFFVNPMIWELIVNAAQKNMEHYNNLLTSYWAQYQKEPFNKYLSNLSMVGHCCENIASLTRDIEKIMRHKEYFENNSSDYYRGLRNNNTLWVLNCKAA